MSVMQTEKIIKRRLKDNFDSSTSSPKKKRKAKVDDSDEEKSHQKRKSTSSSHKEEVNLSQTSSSPKKKKKTKLDDSLIADVSSSPSKHSAASNSDPEKSMNSTSVLVEEDWSLHDLQQLEENVEKELPENDPMSYKARIRRLSWDKIMFGDHTAEDCRVKWTQICLKARNSMKLTYIIPAIKDMINNSSNTGKKKNQGKHPDHPKMPLTPYLRFYKEMYPSVRSENTTAAVSDVAKLVGQKYSQLTDKEKNKYAEAYHKEKRVYDKQLQQFWIDHPECKVVKQKKVKFGRITPQNLYIAHNLKKATDSDPQCNPQELKRKLEKKWLTLKDKKKLKWINEAMEAQEKTESSGNQVLTPESKRHVLTKAEQMIREKAAGKPDKPMSSGYQLYTKEILLTMTHVPAKDKFREASKAWKSLSDQEKKKYNMRAKKEIETYKVKLQEYIESLPEEERKKAEQQLLPKQKANKTKSKRAKKNDNSLSAEMFYIMEKETKYKESHPELGNREILTLLMQKFNSLSDNDKEKYHTLADSGRSGRQKEMANSMHTGSESEDEETFNSSRTNSNSFTRIQEKGSNQDNSRKKAEKKQKSSPKKTPNSTVKKLPAKKDSSSSSDTSDSSSDSEDENTQVSPSKAGNKNRKPNSPVKKLPTKKVSSSSSDSSSDSEDENTKVKKKLNSPVKKLPAKKDSSSSSSSDSSSDSEDENTHVSPSKAGSKNKKPNSPVKKLPAKKDSSSSSDTSDSSSDSEDENTKASPSKAGNKNGPVSAQGSPKKTSAVVSATRVQSSDDSSSSDSDSS